MTVPLTLGAQRSYWWLSSAAGGFRPPRINAKAGKSKLSTVKGKSRSDELTY
jgi:hypothetical protein